jgi:capsular exopolysaccharide synthesis family protein
MRLGNLLAALKLKMRLIAGTALVIAAVAILASLQRSSFFSSEAKVLVKPIPLLSGPMFRSGDAPNMSTEEELMQSTRVVRLVLRRLETAASEKELVLELRVDVAEPPEAQILVLTYSHPDPAVAQQRVQAFADAYIESRRAGALAELHRQQRALTAGIDSIERQAELLSQEASRIPDAGRSATLRRLSEMLRGVVLERRTTLSLPGPEPDVGAVVQDASTPVEIPVPSSVAIGGIGLLFGLAAGIAVAAISVTMDERPESAAKLELSARVPVLAAIPHKRVPRNRRRARLISLASPRSVAAETYRVLGTLIEALSGDAKILLVTSAEAGEGKSTIAANLAVAFAESGLDVALVDCNPRRPSIHSLFASPESPGLVHVLAGTTRLGAALRSSGTERLKILTAGRRSPRSVEALASPRLRGVIEELASTVDFVILDGPSMRTGSDALAVAMIPDAALLVADALIGDADRVSEACQQLRGVGAWVAGAVLNNSGEGASITRTSRTSSTRPRAMASRS